MKQWPKLPVVLLLAATLPACGYIRSLFPDKGRDYQYAAELPPLVLPPDLGQSTLLKPPATAVFTPTPQPVAPAQPAPAADTPPAPMTQASEPPPAVAAPDATPTTATAPAIPHETVAVELIQTAEGGSRLRLTAPFDQAWRTLDKALSRKSIEVSSRDRQQQSFAVHYVTGEQPLQDGSFWDEALFAFRGFGGDEHAFLLHVQTGADDRQTEAVVLDRENKPSTDPAALELLKLLHDTIKADFAR